MIDRRYCLLAEEDSVRCEDKHVQKCENLDDEVDDVPGFMLHKGIQTELISTANTMNKRKQRQTNKNNDKNIKRLISFKT